MNAQIEVDVFVAIILRERDWFDNELSEFAMKGIHWAMKNHSFCCVQMTESIQETKSVRYDERFDEYDLLCSDDNISVLSIKYCPWCGKKLPPSQRDRWFDELEKIGYKNPLGEENVPIEYQSSKWRAN